MLRREGTTTADRVKTAVWPVVGVVAALGFGVLLWEEGLEGRATYKNLDQVEPGLYRSGQVSRFSVGPALRRIDADVIVSLSPDNPENPHNVAEFEAARHMGVERHHVNLRGDGTGDPQEYVDALAHIHDAREKGKTVLVHCWAGSERTSGAAALWRVLVRGESPEDAVAEMPRYGHDLEEGVLVDYLNDNVAAIAAGLVERGVIDRVPDPLPVFRK